MSRPTSIELLHLSHALVQRRSLFTMAFRYRVKTRRSISENPRIMGILLPRKTNIIYERYRFNNRNQDDGESIDTYASNLRSIPDTCNFGALKDEMIRDRIVCGVRDGSLRKKLLQVPELTLEKCIDMCRSAEVRSTQLEAMSAQISHVPPPPEANFVKKPSKGTDKSPIVKDCRFCGQTHEMERSKCPAFGKMCSDYHFALKCSHKKKPHKTKKPPQKHSVNQFDFDESEEEILSVSCSEEDKRKSFPCAVA